MVHTTTRYSIRRTGQDEGILTIRRCPCGRPHSSREQPLVTLLAMVCSFNQMNREERRYCMTTMTPEDTSPLADVASMAVLRS